MTEASNPWNEVNKLSSGKIRNDIKMSTLIKPDDNHRTGIEDTLKLMLNHFTPVDNDDDCEYHETIREISKTPVDTENNKKFTQAEIAGAIDSFDLTEAPGEDGVTSKILSYAFKIFPKLITTMHNGCLRQCLCEI